MGSEMCIRDSIMGELQEGRSALGERATLRIALPPQLRAGQHAMGEGADHLGAQLRRQGDAMVRLVGERENELQPRDLARCLAAANAFQAEILRDTMARVRDGDHAGARRHVERALRRLERLARGVPGAERLLDEAAIVRRSIDENWDERTRKEAYLMGTKFSRGERDRRAGPRGSLSDIVPPRR